MIIPDFATSLLKEPSRPVNTPVWVQFQDEDVRDLAFAIASPDILGSWPSGYYPQRQIHLGLSVPWHHWFSCYKDRLAQLDANPAPLKAHLASLKSHRLGLRFESLLVFWLNDRDYHPFKLIAHNIQVHMHGVTRGEIDFLIQNQESKGIEHWEVALKFYLGEWDFSPEQWYGIERKDTLARKLTRSVTHQFEYTEALGYPIDVRRLILKGRLFYPMNQTSQVPAWVNSEHLWGYWGHVLPELDAQAMTGTGRVWRKASRAEWLTRRTVDTHSVDPWSTERQGLWLCDGIYPGRLMLRGV